MDFAPSAQREIKNDDCTLVSVSFDTAREFRDTLCPGRATKITTKRFKTRVSPSWIRSLYPVEVEFNAMGLPKARSGNFATVYKVLTTVAVHAVRCFRATIIPNTRIRYPEIGSYLNQESLPYLSPFVYVAGNTGRTQLVSRREDEMG